MAASKQTAAKPPTDISSILSQLGISPTGGQPTPIGVPAGYTAPVQGTQPQLAGTPDATFGAPFSFTTPTTTPTAPRYSQGNQYEPAAAWSTDQIIDYQKQLEAAGLLKTGGYLVGVWDDPTTTAYESVLGNANKAGIDEIQSLNQMVSSYQTSPKAPTRAPLVVRLTNPQDIRDAVRQTGNLLYGGALPEDTVKSIVDGVTANEQAYQQANYAMSDPNGPGGTETLPAGIGPSGQVDATELKNLTEDTVRQQHPNEVAATQFSNMFDNIIGTLTNNTSGYAGVKYP